jgi:nitroimidazol reductase NimA-like FMN-containing flavoprotein (pyridoxamine 5'-phosphate oxidase superfamily)
VNSVNAQNDFFPPAIAAVLSEPNPAVIATVDADGYPMVVPTWFRLEDDARVLLSIDAQGARGDRLTHLRDNPKLAITTWPAESWLSYVTLQGHVVEFDDDKDLAAIDRMAMRHTGKVWPLRDRERVTAVVQVDRWDSNISGSRAGTSTGAAS